MGSQSPFFRLRYFCNRLARHKSLLAKFEAVDSFPKAYVKSDWLAGSGSKAARVLLLVAILGLAALGYTHGSRQFLANENDAGIYQKRLAPALSLACTGRMTHFIQDEDSRKFLNSETSELSSCDKVRSAETTDTWYPFDRQSTYYYVAIASVWKIFGISWSSLNVWAAILTSLFAVSAFLFIRVFSPSTILAVIIAILLLYSSIYTKYIPDLRDFSKAPFSLLPLALLGFATTRNLNPRIVLSLFAAVGFCVAVGQGFRPDVAVLIPITILSALILLMRRRKLADFRLLFASYAAFGTALAIGLLPVVMIASTHEPTGNHSPHFFNLGYAEAFFERHLGMASTDYSQMRFYNDGFAREHSITYAGDPDLKRGNYGFPEYDRDGWEKFFFTTETFPHDTFMRPFYALNAMMNSLPERWWTTGLFGLLLIIAATLSNPRSVLFLLTAAGSLICISTLQFSERHYFHLIILFVALGVLGLSSVASLVRKRIVNQRLVLDMVPFRACVFLVLGVGVTCTALDRLLLERQSANVVALSSQYQSKDWKPVEFSRYDGGIGIQQPQEASGLELMKTTIVTTSTSTGSSLLKSLQPQRNVSPSESSSGLEFLMGTEHGYQITTPVQKLGKSDGNLDTPLIRVYVDITVDADRVFIGSLTGDRTTWLPGRKVLKRGNFKGLLEFPAGQEAEYLIVISKPGSESGMLTIRQFDVLDGSDSCMEGAFQVSQNYEQNKKSKLVGFPEKFEHGSETVYYFPAVFLPNLILTGLSVDGVSAECVKDVSWSELSKGDPSFELKVSDGILKSPHTRGSFGDVLPDILFN